MSPSVAAPVAQCYGRASVRGARVRVIDRLTPPIQSWRRHTMRVIKVHRATYRISETKVVCPLPQSAKKKREKENQRCTRPYRAETTQKEHDKNKRQNTRRGRGEICDQVYAKSGHILTIMRLCSSSKKHPGRRSKATGVLLVSIQGGRALSIKHQRGVL